MRIAVLGLGKMGAPMARNLAEIGHQVTVYNRTRARAQELASAGVRVAASLADALTEIQIALTMVADDAAEEALTFGPEGLLARLPAGAIHLCMSTIGVETSRKLAAAHGEKGQGYVAAPVFGRPGAAVSRHLWIVVGGPEAQVNRCLPLFDALGRGLTRVGTVPELAHAVKLGGDLLTTAVVEALSEVLAFGEKAGIPPADYLRLLNTAIFKSPLLDAFGGLMVRHAYAPADLTLGQAAQEARLALGAAEALEATLPMAVLLSHRLQVADSWGLGDLDLSALFRATRMSVGLEGAPEPASRELDPPMPLRPAVSSQPAPPEKPAAAAQRPEPIPPLPAPAKPEPETKAPTPEPPSRVATGAPPAAAGGPQETYLAMSEHGPITLDLKGTTHFEVIKGQVWASHHGVRYSTVWRSLLEVENAFRHILLLRIQRDILLQPETVLDLKPLFGGRSKVLVGKGLELEVSRAATPRLKELLGL
jgi:3-hydroxyisobutyrate dehydrogenase-like beta-hydroxyacid dehydrogenase